MDGTSLTPQQQKLNALREILPEAFSEGKVDWEKLKATLGEDINFTNERYVLNWAEKSEAFKVLQSPTSNTLIPSKKQSLNFDETENIFIEGENLKVLKALQKSYFGKVKMIYIDPPYNTGNDSFIYPDKFAETKEEYEKRVGDKDDEGYMTKDGMFKKNSKENGQYHSNWMNMMYPRLYLAKNLLQNDGVIFISIDDNEMHNLRLIMNEVFGEENFFTQLIVRSNSRGQTYKQIAKTHEYILVYTKSSETELLELDKGENNDLNLNDDIGNYNIRELRNRNPKFGKHNRPNLFYSIFVNPEIIDKDGFSPISLIQSDTFNLKVEPFNSKGIESCWRWGKSKFQDNNELETLKSNVIAKKKTDGSYGIYEKYRKATFKVKSIWDENRFLTETGTIQVKELGFNDEFDFPKPVDLIKQCMELAITDNDIVLDFFAGSATTAHSLMELNCKKNTNNKYICVQLPEPCAEGTLAKKAGYNYISEISIERIKRASKKIKEANPAYKGDLGFKVLKLSDSNFKQWQQIKGNDAKALEEQMKLFVDPVSKSATIENMVYELLLKSGKDLNSKITHKANYYSINDNELIFMLEKADKKIVDAVLKEQPQKVIALDRLFKDNDQLKTNTVLQMKDSGVEFKTI